MRVLVTIPHYYHPQPPPARDDEPRYAAHALDPGPRLQALTACLAALHQLFNRVPCFIDHGKRTASLVEPAVPSTVDVVVCTTLGRHLLERLPVPPRYYTHCATAAEPLLLGFACHDLLCQRLGAYDYYCYLEDDLVLHDPWLFHKLAWFTSQAGADRLLQPSRFEAGLGHLVPKVYVDGDLEESVTAPFQNIHDSGPLAADVLGVRVSFQRTLNPHSGCFFLNAAQMAHLAAQPHFHDRQSRFIGPLETAATLGIMRTFKVYRPAPANADFLEVQHFATGYLERLCLPGQVQDAAPPAPRGE
jgi:hypothetical protein